MKKSKSRVAKKIAKRMAHIKSQNECSTPFVPSSVLDASIPTLSVNKQQDEELNKEILLLKQQLTEAQLKYRNVTQSHRKLKQQLDQYQTITENTEQVQKEKRLAEEQLRLKKDELDIATAKIRASEIASNQLKKTNLKNRIALGEKEQELNQLSVQLQQQQYNNIKIKNHISYLLGNTLVNATKSWHNLIQLPNKLIGIRKEAKSRQKVAQETQSQLLPLLSKSEDIESLKRELQFLPTVSEVSKLQSLKIACIMDTFTYESYTPEAILLQLTPNSWQKELESFQPEILFIESAWRGKHDLWGNKVGHTSQELVGIVEWCKQHNVITLFWNKEDPIHFETFLNTAKLFDHIFTTDIDCISRYKKALGHNQVYFLPFAAQPKVHNPIEKYQRQDKFCFAGAYYVKYPERTKDLNNFIVTLPEYRDIDIYDRNYGKSDPNYMFPEEYQPYIVGTLPYEQIDKAYKGYNYAINLNSIKQSQSMFARRVFELLASNTVTVSNFSQGLRLLFGDLVFTSDSGEEIVRRLQQITDKTLQLKQFRLLALRKVFMEHTYQDRINYIYSKLSNSEPLTLLPTIAVLSYVKTTKALESVIASFQRQNYAHKSLTIVCNGFEVTTLPTAENITLLTPQQAESIMLDHWINGKWLAVMVPEDFYGSDYLTDLALATRYCTHKIIGKKACYRWQEGLIQTYPKAEYQEATGLTLRHSIVAAEVLPITTLRNWLTTLYTWKSQEAQFSIDSLNYCHNGATHCETLPEFQSLANINVGMSLALLQAQAEAMAPVALDISTLKSIKPAELAQHFKLIANSRCVAALTNDKLEIVSKLPDGQHEYWYSNKDFTPAELNLTEGKITLHLESTPGLNLQVVVLFLDAQKQRISHIIFVANKNAELEIPKGTAWIRPGLRVYASGYAGISNLYLSKVPSFITKIVTNSKHLVLSNNYPSYNDLYKNGFVHSRVMAYREHNIHCDIFRFNSRESLKFDEYNNVNKISGGREQLTAMLESHTYESILVHFLSSEMWDVLLNYVQKTKIIIWVHGAEIHPWYRRKYNLTPTHNLTSIKFESEKRMEFWRNLLRKKHENIKLIFVSNSFKNEVFEDLGFALDDSQYRIIHNPINTDLFNYSKKTEEYRKKILSIRPFASRQYANDLSIKVILELSKHSIFNDLSFTIIGDGPLFEDTIEPIKNFHNVTIYKKFLNHQEISQLHREHGLFLCPTRWDSQGVSRDEAMSSGLVPLTTNIAAIPEFVDNSCAILAEPEEVSGIVDGIIELYLKPELFMQMSKAASDRVKTRLCNKVIIEKEIREFK